MNPVTELPEKEESLQAYIMVHHEVFEKDEYPAQWLYLNELVALSDEYEVKLTLSFPPGWAEYILEDEDRLKLLREWELSGYEIAAHHHGASHATWDGYTNLASIACFR